MSNNTITADKVPTSEIIDDAMVWASELSEVWVGTQYEKQIDLRRAQLIKAVEGNKSNLRSMAIDFMQFLHEAETNYEMTLGGE